MSWGRFLRFEQGGALLHLRSRSRTSYLLLTTSIALAAWLVATIHTLLSEKSGLESAISNRPASADLNQVLPDPGRSGAAFLAVLSESAMDGRVFRSVLEGSTKQPGIVEVSVSREIRSETSLQRSEFTVVMEGDYKELHERLAQVLQQHRSLSIRSLSVSRQPLGGACEMRVVLSAWARPRTAPARGAEGGVR